MMNRRSCALLTLLLAACTQAPRKPVTPAPPPPAAPAPAQLTVIPVPAVVESSPADTFTLATNAIIVAQGGAEAERMGRYLAELIGTTRESTPRVLTVADTTRSVIELALDPNAHLGPEAYDLSVTAARVRIVASDPAGLFYGVQTLRQLLPYTVEYTAALPKPMKIAAVHISDAPRYEWRGAMLDVARHFFGKKDVESYIDLLAMYKLNRLHLHLADDQGWRIEIPSWPNLTAYGASTQVGGGAGGFYTLQDFAELVQYARDRFITIVPEIDMPGHTNAALASYPELNCTGEAPPLYTGIQVGFSLICIDKDTTYKFVNDVVTAISAVSPGPYFHVGGDEVKRAGREKYNEFIERVQKIVEVHGKRMIGWSEIAMANLPGSVIVQSWVPDSAHIAVARGSRVILSPGSRLYLDMQYDTTTPIGLHWAGYVQLRNTYDWEPARFNPKLPEIAVLGVEAPLWAETLGTISDIEYMALPRLTAVSELGWSRPDRRDWQQFRRRVEAHELRWTALGRNYRRLNADLTLPVP
ncbi:MAG TPA: beta-N-acetylhexosaminidase [Longimicrobiales bacterium]